MKHENKEVREPPQWVIDILERLDRLEIDVEILESHISYLRDRAYE